MFTVCSDKHVLEVFTEHFQNMFNIVTEFEHIQFNACILGVLDVLLMFSMFRTHMEHWMEYIGPTRSKYVAIRHIMLCGFQDFVFTTSLSRSVRQI